MKKCSYCKKEIENNVKKCPYCQSDLRNWFIKHKILTFFIVIFFVGMLVSKFIKEESSTVNYNVSSDSYISTNPETNLTVVSETDPIKRIEQIVKNIGNFEVSIRKGDKIVTESTTKGPWEVIVNTSLNQTTSCFEAKSNLLNIMKGLYTDDVSKNIERIRFNSPGYLRASLGSNDAKQLKRNGLMSSNYRTVTLQYKSYEDESNVIGDRTRGVDIGNCN